MRPNVIRQGKVQTDSWVLWAVPGVLAALSEDSCRSHNHHQPFPKLIPPLLTTDYRFEDCAHSHFVEFFWLCFWTAGTVFPCKMIPEARTQFCHTYNMWLLHQTKQHLSWVHLKPTVNLIWLSFVYLIKEKYLISRGFITQRRIPSHLIVHLSNDMIKCCSLAWNHAPQGVTHEDFSIMTTLWTA